MITVVRAPKFIDNKYSEDSFALFEADRCVGHVLRASRAPQGKPWFWTIFTRGVSDKPDRGYAATREQAIDDAKRRCWLTVKGIALLHRGVALPGRAFSKSGHGSFKNLSTMRAHPSSGG
jgi:hypothetical protein